METLTRPMNSISRCTHLYRDAALTGTGLTSPQVPYLLRICRLPGLTQEELAQGLHVHKSSVTRTLASLERDGWITRAPSPQDRRALHVYPTDKAEALLPRLRQVLGDWNSYLIQELSPEEADTLMSLLQRVAARAEAWAENREDC